ncbi:hypothetical protein EVAR_36371_1 [Eumeta japonica]|uniref:Mariner Mos1 transposase n=1 Tax=Eumeta variegata TaxID=151549 RepID=A0A4C1W5P3_EUMVA|nr:hypothetical protein EVAR_36371_1 [Eumeta japonica]
MIYYDFRRGLTQKQGINEVTSTLGDERSSKTAEYWFSDESWIYAYDPETKQQPTVWVFQDEPNPTIVIRAQSTLKQTVACFLVYHTSAKTTRFLEGHKIKLTGHLPYSSDLALNDFYLFSSVKNKLRGQRFSSNEKAVDAFKMHVLEIPQSEWKKCYKNWYQRMQKCINHGKYFEKQ